MAQTHFTFADGSHPIGIWLELHSTERQWKTTYTEFFNDSAKRVIALEAIGTVQKLLSNLAIFPADRWRMICGGQGWTPVGCAAVSWCQGAGGLEEVTARAEHINWRPETEPGRDFAALIINPAVLPDGEIGRLARSNISDLGLALMIASQPSLGPIVFNSEDESCQMPITREMLRERKRLAASAR